MSTLQPPPGSPRSPDDAGAGPASTALGILIALLVLASLGTAYVAVAEWAPVYAVAAQRCAESGGAWECLVNPGLGARIYLPVVAVLGALSLARGAGVERRPRPVVGFALALAGVALLAIAWSVNR